MKKYLIILVSVMFLTFPAIVNAASLNKYDINVEVGNTYSLHITEGYESTYTVEWSSDKTSVATVTAGTDGTATVNAIAGGSANITAKIKNAEGGDVAELTCRVTVPEATPSPSPSNSPEPSNNPTTTKYNVTFNTNGGSNVTSQEVEENSKATKPNNPTKDKYKFVGWYSDEDLTKEFSFDTKITKDITLYAKWEEIKPANVTLTKITITGGKLKEEFKSDVFTYTLILDEDTLNDFSKFKIDIVEADSKNVSTIISNASSLEQVKKGIKINIVDKNNKDNYKTYTLTPEVKEVDVTLKSLSLTGYSFKDSFESVKTIYEVSIPNNVTSVTINATPNDSTSKVTINARGANVKNDIVSDLPEGTTTINIVVTNSGESKTYYIHVTRAKENTTGDLKEENDETQSEEINAEDIKPTKETKKENKQVDSNDPVADTLFNKIVVTFGCIVLFAIGGLGIYFYVKTSPKKMKKEVLKKKKTKETSPIVEVKKEEIKEILDPLEETKEYKK